jgi:AcrR family transcriptional regulator
MRQEAARMTQQQEAPRRARLNKDVVLRAAVALAEDAGIDGLTMRALSQELGVVPMALYKHVANKDELIDGMVDLVFAEVDIPRGVDWKTAMRERAMSMREALRRHRWAIGMMESRMRPGPANLRHHNAVMACLREAGFSFKTTVHAYSALDSYTYGFALQEKTLPFETPEQSGEVAQEQLNLQPASAADEYPYLVEVVVELGKAGYDAAAEFEIGLDLLLDGIEKLRPEWTTAGA